MKYDDEQKRLIAALYGAGQVIGNLGPVTQENVLETVNIMVSALNARGITQLPPATDDTIVATANAIAGALKEAAGRVA
jgi:hypothetical protein